MRHNSNIKQKITINSKKQSQIKKKNCICNKQRSVFKEDSKLKKAIKDYLHAFA